MNASLKQSCSLTGLSAATVFAAGLLISMPAQSRAASVWTEVYDGGVYGNDYAKAGAVDKNGDVIVTGQSTTAQAFPGMSTVMYDPSGKKVWEHVENIPGDTGQFAHLSSSKITLDSSGNATVLGQIDQNRNAVVATYTPTGKRTRRVEIDFPFSNNPFYINGLQVYPNGDISVVGSDIQQNGNNGLNQFWFVARYDTAGKRLWYDNYTGQPTGGEPVTNFAVGGVADAYGNLFVGGTMTYDTETTSMGVMEYDPEGNKIASTDFEESDITAANAVAFTADSNGGLYVVGQVDQKVQNGGQTYYKGGIEALKFTFHGPPYGYYYNYFPAGHQDTPYAIALDKHDDLLIAGSDYSSSGGNYSSALRVLKLSPTGRKIWSHTSNSSTTYGATVYGLFSAANGENFYAVLGLENDNVNDNGGIAAKIVTDKFASDGTVAAAETYIGSTVRPDEAYATAGAYDPTSDSVYAVGYQIDQPDKTRDQDYNWVTLKYQFGK